MIQQDSSFSTSPFSKGSRGVSGHILRVSVEAMAHIPRISRLEETLYAWSSGKCSDSARTRQAIVPVGRRQARLPQTAHLSYGV